MSVPRTTWKANEPIALKATLTYNGDNPRTKVAGSGSGLVGFSLKELTGRRSISGAQTGDCRFYSLARNVPVSTGYIKSGGYDNNDPDRVWIQQFLNDRLLRLPAGRWRVTAMADFFEQTCDMDQVRHQMVVNLDLVIT